MFQEERCCYSTFHKYTISRENWLSLVIQATWEARTVGWLEKEGSLRPGSMICVAALYGQPAWEGQLRRSSSCEDTVEGGKYKRTRVRASAKDPIL